jgi:5-methylcytosine-specific restriction endonuclease McrA
MKLTIELVPSTAWYSNVRSNVTPSEWDVLRKECYKKAGYKCEICSGKGPKHPVECHEIWEYDDNTCTQTLGGLIALCPSCHQVKHIGLAQIQGNYEKALAHLAKVNGITEDDAKLYVESCFETWSKRSQREWKLDITILESNSKE